MVDRVRPSIPHRFFLSGHIFSVSFSRKLRRDAYPRVSCTISGTGSSSSSKPSLVSQTEKNRAEALSSVAKNTCQRNGHGVFLFVWL
ncbi:hypothetical protein R1flu_024743 [Riccia fluitans]|uniref:Uncharacterized protein n=1 Tax=Riccia fluitans TaxID=41844 RepID=A0ABD1XYS3_9MARC